MHLRRHHHHYQSLLAVLTATTVIATGLQQQAPEVTFFDYLVESNVVRHKTKRYETDGRFLVLRRGETFEFNVKLARPYNRTSDKFRLEFCFGDYPTLNDSSLVYVPLVFNDKTLSSQLNYETIRRTSWDARIIRSDRKQVNVQVYMPPSIPIGLWTLRISTKLANATELQTFLIRDKFFIIFNPWNSLDDVYMPNEESRQEYVLNEVGKIYVGSSGAPVGRKWTYAQFDRAVLPTVIQLLDKVRLSTADRADVVKVSRAVSAIVNSHDEGGLLVGNWSGNYLDGLSPWQWTGSAKIFQTYIQNGYRPVKFGQCWVFGGVTTSTLRTLGIPARTISNFVSAHDTDSSLTVDKFYSNGGGELRGVNGDSIWNFHVWSDAWMLRRDLPVGYGGWQAIDATPQEQSVGMYQLGPASLEAIKRGKTGFAYDVKFVFAEVNADLVDWQLVGRAELQWRKTNIKVGHVGRKILTKAVGLWDDRSRSGANDAENIINQYKQVGNATEARRVFAEAAESAGLLPLFKNN